MNEEFEKLKGIIADVLNVDPEEISEDTTFAEDLGADSLDLYQILMGIEDTFGITAAEDEIDLDKVKKVSDALLMIKKATGDAQ